MGCRISASFFLKKKSEFNRNKSKALNKSKNIESNLLKATINCNFAPDLV